MKITQSRNKREGKFLGYVYKARVVWYLRGEFGAEFRALAVRNKLTWSGK